MTYFNKICSICSVNTHIQSLKVWLKSILSWLQYSIFSRGLFFIGAPCIYLFFHFTYSLPVLSCGLSAFIKLLLFYDSQ